MQALRMASFMHKPTLLGIQALIMIGPFLTNSGRFLDAWTLFGTTVRLAQSIGLHRHPKYLDPAPPTQRECSIRQTLWWWMLHMDQEYSMTLGRPLGISGIGDCPPPHELTTNPQMLRFGDFVNHFTLLARQILSSDRLTNSKIDEFTDLLRNLLETMPEMLQFDESWLDQSKEIPEWPLGTMAAGVSSFGPVHQRLHELLTRIVFYCKTHTYLILLNRQRMEKQPTQLFPQQNLPPTRPPSSSFLPINMPGSNYSSPPGSPTGCLRGRALVLSSSQDLLTAFLFFHFRVPAAQITWTMGQQAFNSCMILLLDAMETGDFSRIDKVEKAYVVFQQLEKNGVHDLASMAVERVSWGLVELGRMRGTPDTQARRPAAMLSRGGVSEHDVDMQGAAANEARQGFGVMHDTVMGNTGMLLLEDPGLQSFVPEAFAPLNWSMGGGFLDKSAASLQTQGKDEEKQKPADEEQVEEAKAPLANQDDREARSSEQRRAASGSPGSAAVQFATFSTAPSQDFQPQGLTAPTSSPTSATNTQEQHDHQHRGVGGIPPPHLRHHSFPSLHKPPPPTMIARSRRQSQDVETTRYGHGAQSRATEVTSSWEEETEAERMHGMLHQYASSRPSLQTLPEYATASAPAPLLPFSNPNVHPSWAARPAAPYSSVSEPTLLTYSQMPSSNSSRNQAMAAFAQQQTQTAPMPTWQHTVPFHMSSSSSAPVPASARGTQAEHFTTHAWHWGRDSGSE